MLKADLHIHTMYSMDCVTPIEKIVSRCMETGINCIAIADHGTAEGGLKMQKIAPFPVIVAEEILTPDGEIMGMFLKETIPSRISIEEAIERIKAQDGLVGIPHPFDTFGRIGLGQKSVEKIIDKIDFLEAFNSRSPFKQTSVKVQAFAKKHNIPFTAGSDAHTINEIGKAYVEMPEFKDKNDFLQALAKGKVSGRRASLLVHLSSIWAKIIK